jgi:hypothetical protein
MPNPHFSVSSLFLAPKVQALRLMLRRKSRSGKKDNVLHTGLVEFAFFILSIAFSGPAPAFSHSLRQSP